MSLPRAISAQLGVGLAAAVAAQAAPASGLDAMTRGTASVSACTATRACGLDASCTKVAYRASILTVDELDPASGAARTSYFTIAPLPANTGGGLFTRTGHVPVLVEPGSDPGALAETVEPSVHAFWIIDPTTSGATYIRPAREVPGLKGDGRAITSFNCKQVLF